MAFRKDFVWGAATASYQVEGAAYEYGKGLNMRKDDLIDSSTPKREIARYKE